MAVPFVVATIVLLGLVTWSAAIRISRPYPLTPWESAIIADAWRVTQGIAVYTNPASHHATHMYGPLITYLNAGIFELTGPNLFTPRLVALIATIATCALLTFALTKHQPIWMKLFAFALFAAQFFVARAAHAETRPDAISVMFATIGLMIMYRGDQSNSVFGIWVGAFAIVIAAFFKQTAIIALLVPIEMSVSEFLANGRILRDKLWPVIASAVIIGIAVLATFFLAPFVWQYMVKTPTEFDFAFEKIPRAIGLLIVHGCFAATVLAIRWRRFEHNLRKPKAAALTDWLFVAVAVTTIFCMAAFIKFGGGENSLLPSLMAMNALAIWCLPDILRHTHTPAFASLLLAALAIAQTILPPRVLVWAGGHARHGDKTYAAVIERVRELPGRVVCFDDPTIPLFADRDPGRSLDCELDAVGQKFIPPNFLADVKSADWIVRVHATWDAHLKDTDLQRWGFSRVDDPKISSNTYSLWKRLPVPLPPGEVR